MIDVNENSKLHNDYKITGFHQTYPDYFDSLGFVSEEASATGECYSLPVKWGQGKIERLLLRPGLEIIAADYKLHTRLDTIADGIIPAVELSFCLEGSAEMQSADADLRMSAGHCHLALWKDWVAAVTYHAAGQMRFLDIRMTPQVWDQFFAGDTASSLLPFSALLGSKQYRIFIKRMTPQMTAVVKAIFNCMHTGAMRKLYIEAKTVELLLQIVQEQQLGSLSIGQWSLSERSKLQKAQEILMTSLENPPSLAELAKLSGLSESRLKAGFKKMFNMTVFGYLRSQRMEHAMQLLLTGNYKTAEAALAAGYSNPSHFAAAFRKQFGMNPGAVLRTSNGRNQTKRGGS